MANLGFGVKAGFSKILEDRFDSLLSPCNSCN